MLWTSNSTNSMQIWCSLMEGWAYLYLNTQMKPKYSSDTCFHIYSTWTTTSNVFQHVQLLHRRIECSICTGRWVRWRCAQGGEEMLQGLHDVVKELPLLQRSTDQRPLHRHWEIFDKYFKESGKVLYHLGNDNSNLYIMSLKGYSHGVVKAIEAVYDMFQMKNILNTFSEDAIKSIMLAGAKAWLILSDLFSRTTSDFNNLPFMTWNHYWLLKRNLQMVDNVIIEVSHF